MDLFDRNTRNVVAMTDFQADTGFSALAQVEGYWDALRGNRLMPNRAEIDPRGIESALEYTFILERIAPGMARLRIAGSHLGDLMGMEVRGMSLTTLVSPDGRRQLSDTLEDVFQRPSICEVRLSAPAGFDKPAMDARMILLPMKSDLGDVSRALGCFVARGTIGRKPRRFDVTGVDTRPIVAPATSTFNSQEPQPVVAMRESGMSEPAKPFVKRRRSGDVPYLRLIKSD
ncbi:MULTISPECIES: PAS domain-containing protein [Roseobacteraceae]|uniref:PAS domain protein n=1 Tax=Pseudosulfitobacter pseudonitzschiae TaxID=1402135 RepID=A0A221K019_9RHOB|nr:MULTISPECIES: PAS domain-containing protein [Roseobacteraceae]ASM72356.1 PAS domain protein [Pseudosulfitobacter pseudonitzschiae]